MRIKEQNKEVLSDRTNRRLFNVVNYLNIIGEDKQRMAVRVLKFLEQHAMCKFNVKVRGLESKFPENHLLDIQFVEDESTKNNYTKVEINIINTSILNEDVCASFCINSGMLESKINSILCELSDVVTALWMSQ